MPCSHICTPLLTSVLVTMFFFGISVLAVFVFSSEACPPIPIKGTTEPVWECPIGGETSPGVTCRTDDNIITLEAVTGVVDCRKY